MTTIPASLDTAYARQSGLIYTGFPVPQDDDSVPAELIVFAEFYDCGLVMTNVGETPVRVELTPAAARQYAAALLESAAEAEAGHLCCRGDVCCGHAMPVAMPGGAA
jgi:hypothetical protein